MKLQNQVPSLELCQEYARLMKEKGRDLPSSLFYWVQQDGQNPSVITRRHAKKILSWHKTIIPALTVSELGEELPEFIGKHEEYFFECFQTICTENEAGWQIRYSENHDSYKCLHSVKSDTEADARQKMLNYLLANDLI